MTKDIEATLRDSAVRLEAPPANTIAEHAAAEGLLDVAYATVDSPLGPLVVAATPRGLARVSYGDEQEVLLELAAKLSPRVLESPARLDDARRELDEYFTGRRERFDLKLD